MNEEINQHTTEVESTVETPLHEGSLPEQSDAATAPSSAETAESSDTQEAKVPQNMEEAMLILQEVAGRVKALSTELEAEKGLRLRLQADFENFRKRKTKESSDAIRFANQDLMLQLLPVLDNFDRTLEAIDKTDNLAAVKDGILVVDKSMKHTLQKIGLEPIHALGKALDPEVHEVITTVPVEDPAQEGTVIDEIEKGYKLKDRVIRVAKVIIGEPQS